MADDLHHADFFAWTRAQAEALRARRAGENALDYDNLAEEVEDMGKSEQRACASHVRNILLHLLLIEHVGGRDLPHWKQEVTAFRIQLEDMLTPTLQQLVEGDMDRLYGQALRLLRIKPGLEDAASRYPAERPYDWQDVTGRGSDWLPETPAD